MIAVMAAFMLVLHMEYSNIMYARAASSTHADAIADSAAVYSQSYDYAYNQSQAEIMTTLLTAYNNGTTGRYELTSDLQFPADDTLTLTCHVQTYFYSPSLTGHDTFTVSDTSTVKSVDIWGDIFVVPDSLGHTSTPPPSFPPSGDAFDAATIDFFGFPGKVYSDLQIFDEKDAIFSEEEPPMEQPMEQPKASSEATAAKKESPSADNAKDEKPKEKPQKPSAAEAKTNTKENDKPFPPAKDKAAGKDAKAVKETAKDAVDEPATEKPAAEEPAADAAPKDEFDETIIVVGSMKRAGLSVRECYKQKPDSIRWIAYQLTGKPGVYQEQKDVCRRFLESIGDTEGEMGNAS